jgi:hypothetical protein
MVAGAIVGNISAEATTPAGNTFAEAMRGAKAHRRPLDGEHDKLTHIQVIPPSSSFAGGPRSG